MGSQYSIERNVTGAPRAVQKYQMCKFIMIIQVVVEEGTKGIKLQVLSLEGYL
jgi:hypothetical protein